MTTPTKSQRTADSTRHHARTSTTAMPTASSTAPIPAKAWWVYAAMCAIFGTTFLAIRVGSDAGAPPFLAAGVRFTAAGTLLVLLHDAVSPRRRRPSRGFLLRTAVLGLLIVGVTFAATYVAVGVIGSGPVAQIQAVSPVMVALFAALLLKTRLTAGHGLGLAFGLIGTLLLVGAAGTIGGRAVVGAVVAFSAEISYSLGSIWFRRAFPRGGDSVRINGYGMMFGGVFLLILAVAGGQTRYPTTPPAIFALVYLIVFGSIGAHSMYLWLVDAVSPLFASTWLFISPVVATILGVVVLNESVTVWNAVGGTSVLVGVYLIQRGEQRGEQRAG